MDTGAEKSSDTESHQPGSAAASGGSPSVFLSYASQDADVANAVYPYLESHGVSCWMAPRDVKPGAQYADAIVRAINETAAMVVVLSANAVASSHVGREIERAASKRKSLIAFRLDAAPLSPALEYFLSESQWIDAPALGMPAALAKLAAAVGRGSEMAETVDPVVARTPVTGARARGVAIAGVIVVGVGLAIALGMRLWSSRHMAASQTSLTGGQGAKPSASESPSDKSIAVLPFADMSQKKDQEYFGDGMAEEILDLLAKIPGLTVIGRTSSFEFKGKNEDLRKIGSELNAAYVLEGSVRNSADQVRITAQLINTKTGAHEWSETYDRPFGDVLKLQDAIAAAVVRELQLTVDPGHLQSRSSLKSTEAYDLLLRGRHAADRWDQAGFDEALTLFQQALERDPASADAFAELASDYYKQGIIGFLPPAAAFEPARRAAVTALKLDPGSAVAHVTLGKVHLVYDWDWVAAQEEFKEAAALAPGNVDVRAGEAHLLLVIGRWDDALRKVQAALAVDPLDPNSFWLLMQIQMHRGNFAEAEAANRRLLDIRPTFTWGHNYLGLVLLARGQREAALAEINKEPIDEGKQQGLAMVYHALGQEAESNAALTRFLKENVDEFAFMVAEAYAFRGQPDEAMNWLERAYGQKDCILHYVRGDWPLRNLETNPRYKAFLKKMNLPQD